MDRRTRNVFAIILVVVIAVTGGVALILGGDGAGPAPTPPAGTSAVDGVVVAVDAASLTDVRSFDLRAADGRILTFGLGELQNGVAFPPGHLAEHQVTATPVRVWYEDIGGILQALYLEDAPPS